MKLRPYTHNESTIMLFEAIPEGTSIKDLYATARQMGDFLGLGVRTIERHLKKIKKDKYFQDVSKTTYGVALGIKQENQWGRGPVYYNHEFLFELLFLVRDSEQARRFRRWATKHLVEIIDHGHSMEPRRKLQEANKIIRELAMISKHAHPNDDIDVEKFMRAFHNTVHIAVHGHTAKGVIIERFDFHSPIYGIISWVSGKEYPRARDAKIGLNWLTHKELRIMTEIVYGFAVTARHSYETMGPWTLSQLANRLSKQMKDFHMRTEPVHPPITKGRVKALIKKADWKKCKFFILNGGRVQAKLF